MTSKGNSSKVVRNRPIRGVFREAPLQQRSVTPGHRLIGMYIHHSLRTLVRDGGGMGKPTSPRNQECDFRLGAKMGTKEQQAG